MEAKNLTKHVSCKCPYCGHECWLQTEWFCDNFVCPIVEGGCGEMVSKKEWIGEAKKRKAPLPWKEDGYESLKDYKEQIRMNVRELNRDIDRYELDEKKFTIKDMEDEYRKRGMYGDLKKKKVKR